MPRTTKQQQKAVYLPPELVERLPRLAQQHHRSWNAELLVAVEQYVEQHERERKEPVTRTKTPSFLLELPLSVDRGQAARLRAHFEAARCLYNALLGEAMHRLKKMRADHRWQQARDIPHKYKQERGAAFQALRTVYRFSEYDLHAYATQARTAWIADHIDSNTAQTLASRAFAAVNRVCLGKAKRVRFRSRGRGLDSLEGKTNKQGVRFVLHTPLEGNEGWLSWQQDRLPALLNWDDPVVKHGLDQSIKYVRLVRRLASSPRAQGADEQGYRSSAQSELSKDQKKKRRLQRKLDRQRRANNPQHYDEKGRVKKGKKHWHDRGGYKATRLHLAAQDRRLAAHRKSLHGRLAHEIVSVGTTLKTEKLSYKAWQKQYGKSVGAHAPGMFLRRVETHGCKNWRHPHGSAYACYQIVAILPWLLRGNPCPKALVFPAPERVGSKVSSTHGKSCGYSRSGRPQKRRRDGENPPCFSRGRLRFLDKTAPHLTSSIDSL